MLEDKDKLLHQDKEGEAKRPRLARLSAIKLTSCKI